jgi:hypothetical protein
LSCFLGISSIYRKNSRKKCVEIYRINNVSKL